MERLGGTGWPADLPGHAEEPGYQRATLLRRPGGSGGLSAGSGGRAKHGEPGRTDQKGVDHASKDEQSTPRRPKVGACIFDVIPPKQTQKEGEETND